MTAPPNNQRQTDPTASEIATECLRIQAGWTADEKLKRLRADLRPSVVLCDGRRHDITSDDYHRHHRVRADLQEVISDELE